MYIPLLGQMQIGIKHLGELVGVKTNQTDIRLLLEDREEKAIEIECVHEDAAVLPLVIERHKLPLTQTPGDLPGGGKRACRKCGNGVEVKHSGIPRLNVEVATFINESGPVRFGMNKKILQPRFHRGLIFHG